VTALLRWLGPRLIGRRRVPVNLQSGMLECAHACLSMIARYHGHSLTLQWLLGRFVPSTRGTSVDQLVRMGRAVGLQARVYRAEPQHLGQLELPCVIHWDVVHFVVLESCNGRNFGIVDPSIGRLTVEAAEFDRRFTGIAVELVPGPDFHAEPQAGDGQALALLRNGLRGSAGTIAAAVVLALLLESLALVAQVATQSII